MARNLAIVFSPDYASELRKLAFRTPVWILDTPENHAASDEVMAESVDWPQLTVTLFRSREGGLTSQEWRSLLEQIALQERALDGFEVIGTALSLPARAAFDAAGFTRFEELPNGFRARR